MVNYIINKELWLTARQQPLGGRYLGRYVRSFFLHLISLSLTLNHLPRLDGCWLVTQRNFLFNFSINHFIKFCVSI